MHIALLSQAHEASPNMLWVSKLGYSSENPAIFKDASGRSVSRNPRLVRSAYDSEISHDVSDLYNPKNQRFTFIANFSFNTPGLVWSLGFDSGVETSKLRIGRGIFLGATKAFQLGKGSYLALGSGGWVGGRILERPCYDDYDRAYWCQNLTAWTDYRPHYPRPARYADVRYLYQF